MKTNTLSLLGVSLLFSTLILHSLALNCGLLAGKNGSDIAAGPLPSSNGFRHGVSLNLVAGAQIVPHIIYNEASFDFFMFSSPSENVIKKVTFNGQVQIFSGSGIAGYHDGTPSTTQYNSPRGISYDIVLHHLYVADYNNQKIRFLDLSVPTYATPPSVDSTTLYDFTNVIYPIAVFSSTINNFGCYVLGDNHDASGQSIGLLGTHNSPVNFVVPLISAFSLGECTSITQTGYVPNNVYFGCGTTIRVYDKNLNHLSDFTTSFTGISGLYMDPRIPSPTPLYVTDSGANVLYNFDVIHDTKSVVAGTGGAYDGSNDNYGVTDCTDVSFNSMLSVSTSNFGTLVMLTETNIYVSVPSSPTTFFPNVVQAPIGFSNPTPNLLTLNFNSYNTTSNTLHTTLNFQSQYALFADRGYGDTDFVLVDSFIIHWWQNGSSDIQNVTLLGDQISNLNYDFTDFESGLYYYIKLQYQIYPSSLGLSVDTTYIFGPETKLISGSPNSNVWHSHGSQMAVGIGSSASYDGSMNSIAFDPVHGLFYFADLNKAVIVSISLRDGTEAIVAGTGVLSVLDGQGLNAEFEYPLNAVFDPINRLLYVADGGNSLNKSFHIRTIDVDNNYNVQTIYSIIGFSALINTFTVDGSGNLYIYDSNNHWNYVTKSGSTYTVSSSHVDETEGSSDGVNLVFWTQGDICQNSGVSSCLVVQNSRTAFLVGSVYGPIYTVRTDTWAANIINLGNYIFDSIAVDHNGNMYVYSPLMGLGQYLPNQGLMAWFGGYSLSVSSYMAEQYLNTDPNYTGNSNSITELYTNTLAALTQYDTGHGDSLYFDTFQPITFDNNGSVYLFDNFNFRQYSFPQPVVVGTTTTSTTTTTTTTSTSTTSTPTTTTITTSTPTTATSTTSTPSTATTGGVSTTSTTGSSITSGSSTTGGGHNNINKVPLDCYSLSVTVDKGLRKVNPTQTFTLQDFGCNTTFWEIVGVNTTALYSYANNKLVLNIPTNTSGTRPAHYQIAYTKTGKSTHQVVTNITIVNHNPVINNATFTWTYPRTTQTFPTWNLLTGCADQDGDSLSVVQIMKTNARAASTIVQYDPYTMLFVTEKALLQVTPNGQIRLSSPNNINQTPVTAGQPLPLFWKQNLSFQFEITDGDVVNPNAWGIVNINYN